MRAFIAIAIDDRVREQLARFQERMRAIGAHVSWVRPCNMHITVVFLGDVSQGQAERIRRAMEAPVSAVDVFRYDVVGVGAFGSARSPRILWAGVPSLPPEMKRLHEIAADAAHRVGVNVEKRPFKAHITLGRVRGPRRVDELTTGVASAKNTRFGCVTVGRLLLMKSTLSPKGPEYSTWAGLSLKGEA